ncbi:MAG: hypothetical protein C4536_09950 [Actinobacteria bacterium]|nr:MAG: hypothetical protein C4536_09950 [Actinomycetota bacterium]
MRRAMEREEGFTLVELMIAFLILALIVYAAFNLMDVNIRAGTVYTLTSDISQELREASSTMVDQLRTARSFADAQASSVTFTSYLTGTNDLYNVQFLLQDGNLIHRSSLSTPSEADNKVLATNVTGLQFTYYDSTGTELTDPGSSLAFITLVELELTISMEAAGNVVTDSVTTMARTRR